MIGHGFDGANKDVNGFFSVRTESPAGDSVQHGIRDLSKNQIFYIEMRGELFFSLKGKLGSFFKTVI